MDHGACIMIRPSASIISVTAKISELYPLGVTKIKQLEGYDDLNFFVECERQEDGAEAEKYVCKIMNNIDSLEIDVVEAQHQIMERLHERGIVVSLPVLNRTNQYFSVERFNNVDHVFRLLTYIDGSKLNDSEPSSQLYNNVGELVGKIYLELKGLEIDALHSRNSQWMLKNAPQILQYLPAVADAERRDIVKSFVKEFEDFVVPMIPNLESGVIHGDVNEHNLLVEEMRIAGLIDFGDVCYAPFLFEIAICLTYMILHAKDLSVGREVLKGYQKFRQLTATEIRLLRICVCSRMCQSLVLGCQSAVLYPGNEYALSSQKYGWPLLHQLFQTANQRLLALWGLEKS
ncbi:aminoglycoside phosphotransferase domain containing 1 [Nesidiocoris tenuis]|uniref:Hydroxylysine kinase n=1 Tax=Nesidiocoris tenuis TaxID=355587 RepID=A0ABN7AD74_9HEMI|nr:aminoglycoside phosphotransferase domain containing 1 [Nesidiocoris tenuis]